jgi:hypothetical protein
LSEGPPEASDPSLAFSAGTRAAGVVIALGYLLGLVPGPIVAVVGGLALVTFGRGLLCRRGDEALAGAALAVIAGALGVAALRWETLDLAAIRGIQSVLGPTVLVEPSAAATAAWFGASGGAVAVGAWLSVVRPSSVSGWLWWVLEGIVGALALVTVFWGPALVPMDPFPRALEWAGAVASAAAVQGAIAIVCARFGSVFQWVTVGVGAVAVTAGAALIPGVW